MSSGIRFRPPPMEITSELRWLLWRAFGPVERATEGFGTVDGEVVRDLALRFNLAARVGARTSPDTLASEIGSETGQWFRQEHATAAARVLLAESVCQDLAEKAKQLDTSLVFLKGAALQLDQKVITGSRNMGDVDVLVPEPGARALQEALIEDGCEVQETRESEHQLQYLFHRLGLGIEVHKIIPGVRLEGESSATAEDLVEGGLVRLAPGFDANCYLPKDEVMLAHLLVHGIAQHGMAPDAYPMSRMLADVQDLGAGDGVWDAASRLIERDVSRDEVDAVAELVRQLGLGEDPTAMIASEKNAGIMLRHILAGVMDRGYAKSLKFRDLGSTPTDRSSLEKTATTLRGALLLKDAQVDILYGQPKTKLGYWGWRLWRPFDLVGRSFRYGVAWIRNRFRR